jgi:2-polyprenyl-3-methyl-5-hydroxy-6-metoxy-1,4-benzoquinol methylase
MFCENLKKYKEIMKYLDINKIEVLQASAEALPFRRNIFNSIFALEVLEHLENLQYAISEINRTISNEGCIVISLPTENTIYRLSRIGLFLMKSLGNTILKKSKISIFRKPGYHYAWTIKSEKEMYQLLNLKLKIIDIKFSPFGFNKNINLYSIYLVKKSSKFIH